MFEYHRSDEQTYGGPSMHLPQRQNRSQRLLSVSFGLSGGLPILLFPILEMYVREQQLVLPEHVLMDAAKQYFEDIDLEQLELLAVLTRPRGRSSPKNLSQSQCSLSKTYSRHWSDKASSFKLRTNCGVVQLNYFHSMP